MLAITIGFAVVPGVAAASLAAMDRALDAVLATVTEHRYCDVGHVLDFALKCAELAERERSLKDLESRRLRSELEEVRAALEETRLVYCSPQMEALLDTIRRVAEAKAR